jgi:hypothetical protein
VTTRVFGKKIDKSKVKVRDGIEHFLSNFLKKLIAIWSCMKLEDVLEVFPMLMPEKFVEFIFIWGHE